MDPQISSFVQSLALPTAQTDAVANVFSDDSNVAAFLHGKPWDASTLANAGCAALKKILGEGKVDTKPVNTTIVDENWSVFMFLEPCWFIS
jgi:hypothetical protein